MARAAMAMSRPQMTKAELGGEFRDMRVAIRKNVAKL
jgi:hypothetical protein